MSKSTNRNLVAAEMKQKSRTMSGRLDRRTDSNRNRFDWRAELAEMADDNSEVSP